MADVPHFEPVFPAHAIEHCAIAVIFDQELPQKGFQNVLDRAAPAFRDAGYEQIAPTATIQFDVATGRVGPMTGLPPTNYLSPDRSTNFLVAPNSIYTQTGRYVRWQPFIGQVEDLVIPLIVEYNKLVSITGIQLQYLDRFYWTGSWDTFKWQNLVQEKSGLVVPVAGEFVREWHCHSGWFELPPANPLRRLVNVNIDVVEAIRPGDEAGPRPSVGILTLMRDHIVPAVGPPKIGMEPDIILPTLEKLHRDLKNMLSRVISIEMAERIGLQS